jgi:FSR family fosmidomycin resistance protein-like MFS transporter
MSGVDRHHSEHLNFRAKSSFILVGLSSGHAIFHWFTQSFLVMLPEVKATFGLSPVQVGAINSMREVMAGIVTLPGGVLADFLRHSWGLILALCMGGFGIGWLLIGLAPIYPLLLVGMAVVSTASSIWHLPAAASLSHRFAHRRGAALSIHSVGGSLGDVIGPLLTGALLGFLAWQQLLSSYSVVPMFLAFAVFWAFRDIGHTGDAQDQNRFRDQLELTRAVLRRPLLWGVTLVAGIRGMGYLAFVTFLPLYLRESLALSSFNVGVHIGLLVGVGVVSAPVLGHVSDRFGRKLVLLPSLVALAAISFSIAMFGEGMILTLLIALLGVFLYSDQPILTATALDIVGDQVATTTLGVLSFSRFILGAASPIIAGFLYQSEGVQATFIYASSLFVLAALLLAFLPLGRKHARNAN